MCHHRLFHFTTKEGADAIRASKMLKKSKKEENGDSDYGDGVYFTKMSPWHHSKVYIVMNNWGVHRTLAEHVVAQGRVDYVVMVRIWNENPSVSDKCEESGRDIWLYKDDDVNLSDHEFEIMTFEECQRQRYGTDEHEAQRRLIRLELELLQARLALDLSLARLKRRLAFDRSLASLERYVRSSGTERHDAFFGSRQSFFNSLSLRIV